MDRKKESYASSPFLVRVEPPTNTTTEHSGDLYGNARGLGNGSVHISVCVVLFLRCVVSLFSAIIKLIGLGPSPGLGSSLHRCIRELGIFAGVLGMGKTMNSNCHEWTYWQCGRSNCITLKKLGCFYEIPYNGKA